MRITLRSLVLALAALAAVAFTANTASAATVRVPFNFNINGKVLPAGNYSVTRDLKGEFLTLRSEDYKSAYTWYALRGDGGQSDPKVTLRFDESDGQYALRNVEFNALTTPRLDKHFSERSTMRIISAGR
jgi:hypothetical protein